MLWDYENSLKLFMRHVPPNDARVSSLQFETVGRKINFLNEAQVSTSPGEEHNEAKGRQTDALLDGFGA